MERADQISKLAYIGNETIASRVDYQICNQCGFRLMRVETTLINEQRLIVKICPICEQYDNESPEATELVIPMEIKLRYFDLWLATHGLDRKTLDCHYHFDINDFLM